MPYQTIHLFADKVHYLMIDLFLSEIVDLEVFQSASDNREINADFRNLGIILHWHKDNKYSRHIKLRDIPIEILMDYVLNREVFSE